MYAHYLTAIATALRLHVRSHLDGKAASVADECVSTLAALANALETGAAPEGDVIARWIAAGPGESPGVHRDIADAHADMVEAIVAGTPPGDPAVREALERERIRGRTALDRMAELLTLPPARAEDGKAMLDPARVEHYVREQTGDATLTLSDFKPVLGGRSRQTALFRMTSADGSATDMVVQRQTPGMEDIFGGTAMECAVMEALRAAGMKVPRILHMSVDKSILGAAFVIMERSPGTPLQADFWSASPSPEHAGAMGEQMAILHAQPLGDLATLLPRPRTETGPEGWLAEIDRLGARLIGDAHGPSVTIAAALAWLRGHVGGIEDIESIVHNDFMFHNVLSHEGQITAVLDWEQVAIGHPAEDLGYIYPMVSAMGAWQPFLTAYQAAGGRAITQAQVDFFALRAILRLMVLVYEGRAAFESGSTIEVVIAGAGAGFAQRLHQRLADVLADIVARDAAEAA